MERLPNGDIRFSAGEDRPTRIEGYRTDPETPGLFRRAHRPCRYRVVLGLARRCCGGWTERFRCSLKGHGVSLAVCDRCPERRSEPCR